jgi:hypothetical protein
MKFKKNLPLIQNNKLLTFVSKCVDSGPKEKERKGQVGRKVSQKKNI